MRNKLAAAAVALTLVGTSLPVNASEALWVCGNADQYQAEMYWYDENGDCIGSSMLLFPEDDLYEIMEDTAEDAGVTAYWYIAPDEEGVAAKGGDGEWCVLVTPITPVEVDY